MRARPLQCVICEYRRPRQRELPAHQRGLARRAVPEHVLPRVAAAKLRGLLHEQAAHGRRVDAALLSRLLREVLPEGCRHPVDELVELLHLALPGPTLRGAASVRPGWGRLWVSGKHPPRHDGDEGMLLVGRPELGREDLGDQGGGLGGPGEVPPVAQPRVLLVLQLRLEALRIAGPHRGHAALEPRARNTARRFSNATCWS